MSTAMALVIAMLLDALLGEPNWLWSRVPHPAVIMGRLVSDIDRRFNEGANRRLKGIAAVALLLLVTFGVGWLVAKLPLGWAIEVVLLATMLAHRSLVDHVKDVGDALRLSLQAGRDAVAHIVGRDTDNMDETAVARGAIESAAENLSDGVIAPIFWFLLGGLPGLLIYKIVNTADSMIGYKTPRHIEFGWAAARLDDLLNWIPARLCAVLIAVAQLRPDVAKTIRQDAGLHVSPNAGWPESAVAVCLNASLAGPRIYHGETKEFPLVYPEGRRTLGPRDIDATIRILWRTWALVLGLVVLLVVVS